MNTNTKRIYSLVLSGLLVAIGIIIPIISPIKIVIGPMSYTLASHVAIMIALFISPSIATAVALGTTAGFLIAGFPLVVVLRALSHVVWAFGGAMYLKKFPTTLESTTKTFLFNLVIAFVHALLEMIIVVPFYLGTTDFSGFAYMVFGLVGLGTMIHSSVDFAISLLVMKVLVKNKSVKTISTVKNISLLKA